MLLAFDLANMKKGVNGENTFLELCGSNYKNKKINKIKLMQRNNSASRCSAKHTTSVNRKKKDCLITVKKIAHSYKLAIGLQLALMRTLRTVTLLEHCLFIQWYRVSTTLSVLD